MREMFAFDPGGNGHLVRFEVSDGQTQFGVDYPVSSREGYLRARAEAFEKLRALMAEHMIEERDLIELPSAGIGRPPFAAL